MGFQSTISINMSSGVPGEMAFDSPWKAQPFTIFSLTSSLNIIGATCCTVIQQGVVQAGAGALSMPGTLNSTTTVTGLLTTGLVVGGLVQGTGIPAKTTIASITNSTTIVLSAAATVSGSQALIFTPPNLGFAGFLVDPKDLALFGTGSQPLAPTLTVPNYSIVECLTMGTIFVTLPAAAAIGDYVIFDNTSGAISTIAPDAVLPNGQTFANAMVDYFTPNASGAQIAVVSVNPTYVIPQAA